MNCNFCKLTSINLLTSVNFSKLPVPISYGFCDPTSPILCLVGRTTVFIWTGVKIIFTIVAFRSSRTDLHSKARCLFKNAPALNFFSYGKKTDPGFHYFFFLAVNCVRLHTCNHTLEVLYSLSSDNTLMFKCPYFLTEPHITADFIFRRNLCYIRQNLIFMLSLCWIITVC